MVTRNVVLTNEQAELVESLVSSGRFQNASEALRAGFAIISITGASHAHTEAIQRACSVC